MSPFSYGLCCSQILISTLDLVPWGVEKDEQVKIVTAGKADSDLAREGYCCVW